MAAATSTAMRGKWPYRACIDLYAGCGVNRIQETGDLWWGSALLALKIAYPFDLYVFCEQNPKAATALAERIADPDIFGLNPLTVDLGSESLGEDIRRITGVESEMKVIVITGDANKAAKYVRYLLPAWEGRRYVLTLLDPQSASFRWDSLTMLTAGEKMDLVFLFPEDMDIKRNRREHLKPPGGSRFDHYFPSPDDWRRVASDPSIRQIGPVLRDQYKRGMERLLEYQFSDRADRDVRICNQIGEIYTLIFCSKHKKGLEIWDSVNPEEFEQFELPLRLV